MGATGLDQRRQPIESRFGEKDAEATLPDLALTEVRVMITVSPERGLGVVQVEARKAIEAHLGIELIDHLSERRGRANLEPGGEQVAGVETDADPRVTVESATSSASSSKFLPSGPWVPAVFEQHRAAVGIRQGGADRLRRTLHRRSVRLALRAPACRTTPWAPIPSPTRRACVREVIDFVRISRSLLAQLIR